MDFEHSGMRSWQIRLLNLIIATAAILLTSCDTHKEERHALQEKLSQITNELEETEKIITQLETQQSNLKEEIEQSQLKLNAAASQLKENKDKLSEYVLNHKLATMAVAATTAGVAGILDSNLDQSDKEAAAGAGIMGIGYCIFNSEDCGDAITKISLYGGQISKYSQESKSHQRTILLAQQSANEIGLRKSPHVAAKAKIHEVITSLRTQIDSLTCKFCI